MVASLRPDRAGKPGFVDEFLAYHLGARNEWAPERWHLLLGVWAEGSLAGVQGIEFLAPLQPGVGVRAARELVRSLSPRLRDDRPLSGDIEAVAQAIRDGALVEAVEAEVGELR